MHSIIFIIVMFLLDFVCLLSLERLLSGILFVSGVSNFRRLALCFKVRVLCGVFREIAGRVVNRRFSRKSVIIVIARFVVCGFIIRCTLLLIISSLYTIFSLLQLSPQLLSIYQQPYPCHPPYSSPPSPSSSPYSHPNPNI